MTDQNSTLKCTEMIFERVAVNLAFQKRERDGRQAGR